MKSLPVLIALVLLAATTHAALAQTVPTTTDPTGTDAAPAPADTDVGHTGTDTLTAPTDTDVGHTGTDTLTTPTQTTVGHTGTDTLTTGPSPWTLSAKSSTISSPGSVAITVVMPASSQGGDASAASYTVPLASSDPACTVPASVTLDWSSTTGGLASFDADCSKVAKRTVVTITGGTASTSFTLKP